VELRGPRPKPAKSSVSQGSHMKFSIFQVFSSEFSHAIHYPFPSTDMSLSLWSENFLPGSCHFFNLVVVIRAASSCVVRVGEGQATSSRILAVAEFLWTRHRVMEH
jgi:hypothetical protein